MSTTITGLGCAWRLHTVVGEGRAIRRFLTHYLVLRPGLLCVDIVILGLLLCLYIHMLMSFTLLLQGILIYRRVTFLNIPRKQRIM